MGKPIRYEDLILWDSEDGTGQVVLQALKAPDAQKAPVIVLTQYPNPAYRERCLEMGADYFFDKSTEFDRVMELLVILPM
jgi:two-component system, OmpR family, response regulator